MHTTGADYTVPIGGLWDTDFELDITQHLQDVDGQPLRQENVRTHTADRAVRGAEEEFDQHTGLPLKALGVTVWRQDHAGKDLERGQRGSSAKNDDVDLVWQLTAREDGIRLKATHRRQSWVPEIIDLVRLEDPLRHERAIASWPSGTVELVAVLDGLDVSPDLGVRKVRSILAEHGHKARNDVLSAAVRYRRGRIESSGNTSGNALLAPNGNTPGQHRVTGSVTHGGRPVTPLAADGERSPSLRGERFPAVPNADELDLQFAEAGREMRL